MQGTSVKSDLYKVRLTKKAKKTEGGREDSSWGGQKQNYRAEHGTNMAGLYTLLEK